MKQIDILKRLVNTPNIYANEYQRQKAKINLAEKMVRRDKKKLKQMQMKIDYECK